MAHAEWPAHLMSTTTLPKPGTTDVQDSRLAEEEGDQKSKEEAQIEGYITEGRTIYHHRLVSYKTREDYEKMWQEMKVKREVKEMSENSRFMYEMITEAESYERRFKLQLGEAVKQKWIGKKTQDNWMKRFNNPNLPEWERKKWVQEEFPQYLTGWEGTANVRKEVWKLAKELKVNEKDVPELKGVLKIQDFLSLHFHDRKHKIHTAKAALLAHKKNEQALLGEVRNTLETAEQNGYIHSSKVGPWMRRVMESGNPKEFLKAVLRPYINNWMKVRGRFDVVTPQLKDRKDITRGFKQINVNQFLLLEFEQRIAYVEEAESRLESDVNEPGKLAGLRLDIRHAMDTGDWEYAELLLIEARKLDPDDKAVRSMGRYLETHRTDQQEEEGVDEKTEKKNSGMEALIKLREIMQQLPPNMRTMTEKALNSPKANTLKRLWQGYYNVHWVITHGYSTPEMDKEQGESEWNKEQTENRIANGHQWTHERNIIKGSTTNTMGIRDECKKPQQIYTNREGLTETYKAFERNADNPQFGYWTSIVDDEIPYESLREAVTNHMWAIRQNARILRESGLMYSSHGIPFSAN